MNNIMYNIRDISCIQIVSPFNGIVTSVSSSEVVIQVESITDVEVILGNVQPNYDMVGAQVTIYIS